MPDADADVRRNPRNAGGEAARDASVHREHGRRPTARTLNVGRRRGHGPRLSGARSIRFVRQ
jgi:hypothetical protein